MDKLSLNYITNLPKDKTGGGELDMNVNTYKQLNRFFLVNYVGPVNIEYDMVAKIISKSKRIIGLRGNYHFFSEKRLNKIALEVDKLRFRNVNADFFRSPTSWINCKFNKPYFIYFDSCFATYVKTSNNIYEFSKKDLNRIFEKEKQFLQNASKVFFMSNWAMEETKNVYDITGNNFVSIKYGGGIEKIPEKDNYTGIDSFKIIFISTAFEDKGGHLVVESFIKFNKYFPKSELTIIGDKPSNIITHPNIKYTGFINKSTPEGKALFNKYLSEAFMFVYPTFKDVNPLVLLEAAYYGCPAIASNKFAIPEIIQNGKTGYLIDDPTNTNDIVKKLISLVNDKQLYMNMRRNTRNMAIKDYTWDSVGKRLYDEISKVLYSS